MSSKFWSDVVQGISPYVPGEQPGAGEQVVKLNTNENPYPPSPLVQQALVSALGKDGADLALYPDPDARQLKLALASYHGVDTGQVFVGNGSDEVLAHTFLGLLKHRFPVLFADVTYSFYAVYCALYEIAYEKVPLSKDFALKVDDYLKPDRQPNGGIVIANPNAPTGMALPLAELERLVSGNSQSVVVIDEAYVDFGGESALSLVNKYANVLVVRTFSKSRSLAGMRVGYAIGAPALIEGLTRVKDSFNSYPLDRLAQAAATASIKDEAYFTRCVAEVVASREALSAKLRVLGFTVLPSVANFIFASHPKLPAAKLAFDLKARGILVRHFNAPRVDNWLRISVGATQACEALASACAELAANV